MHNWKVGKNPQASKLPKYPASNQNKYKGGKREGENIKGAKKETYQYFLFFKIKRYDKCS